jgi:hypothetical protein
VSDPKIDGWMEFIEWSLTFMADNGSGLQAGAVDLGRAAGIDPLKGSKHQNKQLFDVYNRHCPSGEPTLFSFIEKHGWKTQNEG